MEKHPEWTHAATKPSSHGFYLVSTQRGMIVAAYMETLKMWLDRAEDITRDVIAWMPLPPDYEPPKPAVLGWHDGDDKPDYSGRYIVHGKYQGTEFTASVDYKREWILSSLATVIAWMPIPPVPTEILMRH